MNKLYIAAIFAVAMFAVNPTTTYAQRTVSQEQMQEMTVHTRVSADATPEGLEQNSTLTLP